MTSQSPGMKDFSQNSEGTRIHCPRKIPPNLPKNVIGNPMALPIRKYGPTTSLSECCVCRQDDTTPKWAAAPIGFQGDIAYHIGHKKLENGSESFAAILSNFWTLFWVRSLALGTWPSLKPLRGTHSALACTNPTPPCESTPSYFTLEIVARSFM